MKILLESLGALFGALLWIVLPRITHEALSPAILLPAFFLWWFILNREGVSGYGALLGIAIVDALTFTPRGGLVGSVLIAAGVLKLLERLLPSQRLLAAILEVALVGAGLQFALIGLLFLSLSGTHAPFPLSTFVHSTVVAVGLSEAALASGWMFRRNPGYAFPSRL